MALENLTLLFSLALVSGLMALSLWASADPGRRDGMRLWAFALALESFGWVLIAGREHWPPWLSILCANLALTASQSLKLGALYQYRSLSWPRAAMLWPPVAMLGLLLWLDNSDFRGRLIYGSLIYAAQAWLLLQGLRADAALRNGRAWRLVYLSLAIMLPVFLLRSLTAAFGAVPFAQPQMAYAPGPLQVLVFVCLIALGLLGSIGFILMVKERAEREVRALAMTDALTGALNRRAFMERADKELALALRSRLPLALLMLDLDYFKRINDEYGHAAGDAVLVEAARRIAGRLRRQDSFGRYGGEEFCILLPATDESGAWALAETLRAELAARPVRIGKHEISVTLSLGVTVCSAGCAACLPDFGRILEDADRALYQAKGEGRNRAVVLPLNCRR